MRDCPHPQRQNRRMVAVGGAMDGWVTWCPRCHLVCSPDGRLWFHDETLPWPAQLVPLDVRVYERGELERLVASMGTRQS